MKSTINYFHFFLFLIVLNLPIQLNAQCEISDITVVTFGCDSGDTFVGEINFEYSGEVGEFFTYSISGQQDGEYPYDELPMVLDIINVSGLDFFTITISDDTGSGCSSVSEFENPCFENCFIYGISAIPGECNDDDEFELVVDFEYEFTSDFFDLHINYSNGVVIENIPYTALPYTVTGLAEECISNIIIGIYDSADDGCAVTKAIDPFCCSYDLCELSNLVIDVSDCDGTEFAAIVDFDFIGTSTEFNYTVYDNGGNEIEVGSYSYVDLPLDLSFNNTTSSSLKIVIVDQDDNICNIYQDFDNPCYLECLVYNLTAIPDNCINGEFTLLVDFEHENTSGTFDLHITYPYGLVIDDIPYTSLPYTVTGLQEDCDSEIEVLVCDSENGGCLDVIMIDPVCCSSFCTFSNLVIEVSECDGSEFTVDIDFDYTGNVVEFDYILYDYQSNPVQNGSYAYVNLPLTLAIDNTTSIGNYIVITDQEDPNCVIDEYFDNPCYEQDGECAIIGIDFNENPVCDNGVIVTEWFIFSENTGEVGYDIFINGEFVFFVDYESDGLYDFVFDAPNTEYFGIMACDNDNDGCCFINEFMNPCFDDEPECVLSNIIIENTECENGEFTLIIDFDYSGTTNDFYDYIIYGSQNEIIEEGFAEFAQLPLSVNITNTDSEWFYFEINENDNPDCSIAGELFNPCYEPGCNIYSIDFGANPVCENGLIVTEWYIFAENTSEIGYDISINGEFITFVEYNEEGPYVFDIEATSTEFFAITACDNDNTDCCYTWELENPCYEDQDDCELLDLVIDAGDCIDGEFVLVVDFDYSGTSSDFYDYIIYDQMNEVVAEGIAPFSQLPFTIDIANTVSEYFIVSVFDEDNDGCFLTGEFGNPCYIDGTDCFIGNIIVIPNECDDDNQFSVLLDFEYTNTGNQFSIVGNGMNYGLFSYSDLPITLDGFLGDCETEYEFIVHDENNNDCTSFAGLDPVCCDDNQCQMTTLDFGPNPVCENGLIITEWLIDGENISEVGYDIFINGEFQLFVAYEEDSWYDFDIVAPETANFTMMVCDNDNADCCIDWELDNPCFGEEEECELSDLILETGECNDGEFVLVIDFDYSGISNDFYDYSIVDQLNEIIAEGNAPFAELPFSIEITNTDSEYFVVSIFGSDNDDCLIIGEIGNPCFEPPVGDCFIDDVNATVIACEGNVFDMLIDFEYEDTNGQFTINGNDNSYGTFSYTALPITLTGLEADCDTEFEFVIHDVEDNDCTAGIDYGTVCCEDFNSIQEITIINIIDENFINIDINVIISLLNGCELEVFLDDEYYTVLTGETTSFDIGPFDCGTDQVITLTIVNSCTDESEEFVIDLSDIECVTAVNSFDITDLVIWNQVQKQLVINQLVDGDFNLQVLNIDGRLVSQKTNLKSGEVIDLSRINSGVNIVRLIDGKNGKIGLMKILVY